MTVEQHRLEADPTAVRVALWRALHAQIDAAPHVLEDEVGLRLAAPGERWRDRPDMDPGPTARSRASIVARARFIEDLVVSRAAEGVGQYVLLGAGLDTFAQRRPEVAAALRVFEVEQPATQAWKRERLMELGYGVPEWLRLVPVDFEAAGSWVDLLVAAGFDRGRPAVVAAAGVSMYLTVPAILAALRQIAALAPGSAVAMTFLVPLPRVEPAERQAQEATIGFARAAGTPFLSLLAPEEMLDLAREAGFREVRHVSPQELAERYFTGRTDGLRPSSAEQLLVAVT